jgi:hypothetical protein
MPSDPILDPRYRCAKRRVDALKGFYIHLLVFCGVIAGLAGINMLTRGDWWVQWPLLGWGIGLLVHGATVFTPFRLFGPDWEQREIDKQLKKM